MIVAARVKLFLCKCGPRRCRPLLLLQVEFNVCELPDQALVTCLALHLLLQAAEGRYQVSKVDSSATLAPGYWVTAFLF